MVEAYDPHADVRPATSPEAGVMSTVLVALRRIRLHAPRLVGVIAIALGGGPVGVFLMLRRMSLTGDAMAHAILPGRRRLSRRRPVLPAMTVGGLVRRRDRGRCGRASSPRFTALKEDASLAAFYLLSLALGVTIVSLRGSNVDLLHVLFGTVLALDDSTLCCSPRSPPSPCWPWRCSTVRSCSNASTRSSCARSAEPGPRRT